MTEKGIRLDALDEAALRLRNLGGWDNKLADAFQIFIKQVRVLEEYAGIHQAVDKEGLPSQITTWEDFEMRMQMLLTTFIEAESRYHVSTASFIRLARMSEHWKNQRATVPSVLRVAQFGTVVVEWEKPGCALMLDFGELTTVGDEKNFIKHNLSIKSSPKEEPTKPKRRRKPIRKVAQ